ncbi:hypothetical protein B0A49_01836 [Cryomyces minteri]|uniref:Allergen n=1 Tax=Cryomyces minteri TaxID=331657 RepID=A0A4U0XL40_9PEZI|nr:hypothetical protein B0A49_01836 [Cryomyces minteri]
MDKAKAAVSDFMAKSGHHDTTVHEKVAPAVVHETINSQRHEEIQTAIDKEVHQDHYHTSVQPVADREILPEEHRHKLAPVEHRQFEHGNDRDIAARLEQEAAAFRDERIEGKVVETRSTAPVVAAEHIHHHVHETIQPVIQPTVIHTTVPIHEVHHNAPQHHSTSALPAVSMADFKKQGGVLTGREERYDGFEGEPRSVGGALAGNTAGMHVGHTGTGSGLTGSPGMTGSTGMTGSSASGPHSSGLANKADPRVDSDRDGSSNMGATGMGSGVGSGSHQSSSTSGTSHKPSMLDKLNPMKDSDGDGKAGFMK